VRKGNTYSEKNNPSFNKLQILSTQKALTRQNNVADG